MPQSAQGSNRDHVAMARWIARDRRESPVRQIGRPDAVLTAVRGGKCRIARSGRYHATMYGDNSSVVAEFRAFTLAVHGRAEPGRAMFPCFIASFHLTVSCVQIEFQAK